MQAPGFDLDASDLLPDKLLGLSADEVRLLRIAHGRRQVAIGDLFDVSTGDDDVLRIENATPRLRHLGRKLPGGQLHITGTAGDGVGADMRGGTIVVEGDAGDFVGSGMRNGLINISGNAGDFVGGALPNVSLGLRNGVVRIGGSVGARAGDRMRRGLLIINGDTGEYCGSGMIAGTIVVTGRCAEGVGLGMRRGTVLLTNEPAAIPVTFNPCGTYALAMIELLRRYVATFDQRVARKIGRSTDVRRYAGDRGADGQGELLITAP
jgi:formylmethanofuran dehydrogenase subunit C